MSAQRFSHEPQEILEFGKALDDGKCFFPSFLPSFLPSSLLPSFFSFSLIFYFSWWGRVVIPLFLTKVEWSLADAWPNFIATKLIKQSWSNLLLGFTFHHLENKIYFLHCSYQCASSCSTRRNIICVYYGLYWTAGSSRTHGTQHSNDSPCLADRDRF